ncbi:ribosome production factor 1-like protein [Dinothrombium tinctorium]|uniref:Ribosome production factor 1-like protein n=1 Tax=Dinothrombium tinctorium TaxID=1965070 RepID=A0A3S3SDZ6_9ACAR|nr:ribosome production factor 1-like protein [Dinothrombium tinctorium]RWS12863.1 ribosome production factor 1-like protein [Dinothrombium tinctorium]
MKKKAKNKRVSDESDDSDVDGGIEWEFEDENAAESENSEEEDDEVEEDESDERKPKQNRGDKSDDSKPVFSETLLASIKNKLRRRELYLKYKEEKKKAKREARKERQREYERLGENAPPKPVPKTIESTREEDITMVDPNDEEVKEDEATDQFASYFRGEREPKVLITTSDNPHTKTIKFCRELMQTIPNSEFRWRNRSGIKKMVKAASSRGYTDIIIINEDVRKPNALLLIHLPDGPTAFFRLSSIRYCKDVKHRASLSGHRPEVIINNFNTRIGHTMGRMFAALFHFDPQFTGRKVVTFHNQRDYIFFRHHRYEFKNGEKVAIQEIGPRFTLKLKWLQNGTFDTKYGEYEWVLKRHEMETSRRRFFL